MCIRSKRERTEYDTAAVACSSLWTSKLCSSNQKQMFQPASFLSFSKHICLSSCCRAFEKNIVMCVVTVNTSSFKCFGLTRPSLFNMIIYLLLVERRPTGIKVTSKLWVWTRKWRFVASVAACLLGWRCLPVSWRTTRNSYWDGLSWHFVLPSHSHTHSHIYGIWEKYLNTFFGWIVMNFVQYLWSNTCKKKKKTVTAELCAN